MNLTKLAAALVLAAGAAACGSGVDMDAIAANATAKVGQPAPAFEGAIATAGIEWGVERFAYARQPEREAKMLADAVDAGASFAVANCEPNDGGGWERPDAARAIRVLIDGFRRRHPRVPLWICADLRRGRSLDVPFVHEAAQRGIDGWMPMVYPAAFGHSVAAAFDAAFPGATYLGLPCEPVIQTYDRVGAGMVLEQAYEASRCGARALSIYVVETASERELAALAWATAEDDAAALRDTALAYLGGASLMLLALGVARRGLPRGRWRLTPRRSTA